MHEKTSSIEAFLNVRKSRIPRTRRLSAATKTTQLARVRRKRTAKLWRIGCYKSDYFHPRRRDCKQATTNTRTHIQLR